MTTEAMAENTSPHLADILMEGRHHMTRSIVGALSLAAVLFASALPPLSPCTLAAELAGAALPDTLAVGGKTLKLNGLGLRKKAVFKVYVGGLNL